MVSGLRNGPFQCVVLTYLALILGDEHNFLQLPVTVMLAYDQVIFGEGTLGGKDGLSFDDLKH